MQTKNPIKSIAIIGGGTAGWIAAAMLGNVFRNTDTAITLVESANASTIGVGEATIPPFLDFIRSIGIDEVDFIQKTQATFKLGIKFSDWKVQGQSYFHPFGEIGKRIDGHQFYQCWLKTRAMGDDVHLMEHSPEAVLAKQNKFFLPHRVQGSSLVGTRYALHVDASLVSSYLREFAEQCGVSRLERDVVDLAKAENGFIRNVTFTTGERLAADFFIDCTGFKSLLLGEGLQVPYEDWSQYLPCNRAVVVQSQASEEPAPYTLSTAKDAGWQWQIPLQNRVGNGYVFCDLHCSDDEATHSLLKGINGESLQSPRIIPFTTGKRRSVWSKNCIALGLAQGFLEPLESTAIHLVYKTLAFFLRLFPDKDCSILLIEEFNRRMDMDYQEIRDFLMLHYCVTQRSDTEFWRYWKTLQLPTSLQHKIDYFRCRGELIPEVESLFQTTSWLAVFEGMGITPDNYNPTVDALNYEKLRASIAAGKQAILGASQQQPSHKAFINQYCPAK